jgi:hypothetical protein
MKSINLKVATVQQFLNGINTQLAKGKSVTIGNQPYTPAVMTSTLSGYITATSATASAKVAYHDAVAAQRAMAPSVLALVRELKEYVYATYGDAPSPLAAFGLLPRKAVVISAAVRAPGVLKGEATRLARKNALGAVAATAETAPAVNAGAVNAATAANATAAPAVGAVAAAVTK